MMQQHFILKKVKNQQFSSSIRTIISYVNVNDLKQLKARF